MTLLDRILNDLDGRDLPDGDIWEVRAANGSTNARPNPLMAGGATARCWTLAIFAKRRPRATKLGAYRLCIPSPPVLRMPNRTSDWLALEMYTF
jgi:hypothetical protein